jgi:hypothetical protein
MDTFLANRVTGSGWLGRPDITLFTTIRGIIVKISSLRILVAILFLIFNHDIKYRQTAFGVLSLVLAIFDWIPYQLYTWQRQPSILTKWATPVSGAASFLVHAVWVWAAAADRPDDLSFIQGIAFVLLALVPLTCGILLTNIGWLYFVYYPPIRLPPVYEPVLKFVEQGSGDDDGGSASTYAPGGPLARLYQAQKSADNAIEEGREEREQPVNPLLSVRSSTRAEESKDERAYC